MFDNRGQRVGYSPTVIGFGPYNDPNQTTYRVKQPVQVVEGTQVCISGAFSGERCLGTVIGIRQKIILKGKDVSDVVEIRSVPATQATASTTLAGQGDSGAPVYIKRHSTSGDYATPVGMYIANFLPRSNICPANNTGRVCSSDVYAVDLGNAMESIGAHKVYVSS